MKLQHYCVGVALALACSTAAAERLSPDQVMEQWLSLELQKSQLITSWNDNQTILKQQLALHSSKQKELERSIALHSDNQSEVDSERTALLAEQTKLEKQQRQLRLELQKNYRQLEAIHERAPPPLQDDISRAISFLGDESIPSSERLEKLLDTYLTFHQFSEQLHLIEGTVRFSEEHSIQAQQVYFGASMAWFISEDQSQFGYGFPGEQKWRWLNATQTEKELGIRLSPSNIAALVKSLEDTDTSDFIEMPMYVGDMP